MAKSSLTPLKAAYQALCQSSKELSAKILILTHDGTWYIVRSTSQADAPLDSEVQCVYHGWEEFMRLNSVQSLTTTHKHVWPDYPITKALASHASLSTLIWNYRLSKAIDLTRPQTPDSVVKNPLQRASKIATRSYTIITNPPADAKPFTSKAGLACLKIIKDVCELHGGVCTEGQLKPVVCSRGLEITKTAEKDPTSAWRFLQFYRPQLVESQLITYTK